MGRLFFSERGRILLEQNEEITRWRWARKVLRLPPAAAGAPADLWLYLRMYEGNRHLLRLWMNGRALGPVQPEPAMASFTGWQRVPAAASCVEKKENLIELRCDSPAMNAWILGIEAGHKAPKSFVSTDRGETWRNERMGARNLFRGEYAIRLRSHAPGLSERTPPPIVYEDPAAPRVRELRKLVPSRIRNIRDPWRQLLALRAHVARSWVHDPSGPSYAPWDPWTILDWSKRKWGHGLKGTVTMCVHFAVHFAALATALGHKARCVVITEAPGTSTGHFMAEVWSKAHGAWVMHDPNYDVHFEDGAPLSVVEIARRHHQGQPLKPCLRFGPGQPRGPRRVVTYFNRWVATGRSFRCAGVWTANQYISDPTVTPPNHGSIGYCETDIVWFNPPGMDLMPMFPYRTANCAYFERP